MSAQSKSGGPLHVTVGPVAFREGWLTATQRYFKIAEAVRVSGWSTAVVAGRFKQHDVLEVDACYPGEVFRTRFGLFPATLDRRGLRNGWKVVRRLAGMQCDEDIWAAHLVHWFDGCAPSSPLGSADLLCAVTHRNWGVLETAGRLAERLGIPYWIDIQDPLWGTAGRGRVTFSDGHRHSLEGARSIATTSAVYAEHLRTVFPEVAGKVTVLRSPYSPALVDITDAAVCSPGLVLFYGGYLGGLPALSAVPLLDAMARLFAQDPSTRTKLILRLVGGGPGMGEALAHARRLGLSPNLEHSPPVDPGRLSQHIGDADVPCLFMPLIEEYRYRVPGKMAEYLFSNKPILAVAPPGETADIVLATGAGYVVHPTETERLASVLAELLERKQDNGTVAVERDPEKLRPFSFEVFREKLGGILSAAL